MLALGNGHEECARLLMAHGAKLDETVIIQGKSVTSYDYAEAKGQLDLYKKLGGAMSEAPSSMQGKKIYFDYSKARETVSEQIWDSSSKTRAYKSTKSPWSTSAFNKNNKCAEDSEQGCMWNYEYEKTGTNTATLYTAGSGSITESYELTFKTCNSGTASMSGRDAGAGISIERIRFTIK